MKLHRKMLPFFLLLVCVGLLCGLEFLGKKEKNFLCRKVPEGYEIIIYGKGNVEIFSMIYPIEPGVVNITEDILEISISTGNPSRYVIYYDRENAKMSETFFNPILFDDKYVAYMDDGRLILTDIFGEGILYEEIARNFSKTANPISAIISVEMLESGDILLQYYEGENLEIISEVIACQAAVLPSDVFIEKVEYVYNYTLRFTGEDLGFTDNGYRKKALQVVLYWKDGVYYFVPLEACNDELEIGGVSRKVSCIEQKERYEFCTLEQRREMMEYSICNKILLSALTKMHNCFKSMYLAGGNFHRN